MQSLLPCCLCFGLLRVMGWSYLATSHDMTHAHNSTSPRVFVTIYQRRRQQKQGLGIGLPDACLLLMGPMGKCVDGPPLATALHPLPRPGTLTPEPQPWPKPLSLHAGLQGRMKKDLEKLGLERAELQEKVTSLQNQIYKATEKMDQFKLLMNWNQEEIEQWALAQRQKEEDNAAMEKYRHQDAAKMKELTLALEKMSKAVVDKKSDLEAEVMETQAAQVQLDKAADDFR